MKPLIAKEIRLLLPAYGMALLFAILPVWLLPGHGADVITFILYLFGFGIVMLALSSFGREFAMNTFPLLLAQPLERTRIWWTKIIVLACALATVFCALCLSCAIGSFNFVGNSSSIREMLISGALTIFVACAGALWTTLLLRQVIAAFWFTILIPGAILMIIGLTGGKDQVMFAAMCVYSVAGFWLAWRLFSRSQEVAWTGGVINLPGWRTASAGGRASIRTRRPLTALFGKELQLHQLGLMGMGALFVLHLGAVWLRKPGHAEIGDTTRMILQIFGGLWVIVPLLTGCLSVSEERKLGTMQELLCLPFSSRLQFSIKLLFILIVGGLLSALLFWTAEGIGTMLGAGSDIGGFKTPFNCETLAWLSLGFLGVAFIGFYSSTLTRGIVQALAVAVAIVILVSLFMQLALHPESLGVRLWHGFLVYYVTWPTFLATFLWLAWRNFRTVSENWFHWRRNLLGIFAALVFIITATTAIYNRVWETFTYSEPAHGPPLLSGSHPASLHVLYGSDVLAALLPTGQLWVGRIEDDPGRILLSHKRETGGGMTQTDVLYAGGYWHGSTNDYFMPGSNWVDAVVFRQETIGIRADGTLWICGRPLLLSKKLRSLQEKASAAVRVGNGTEWKSAVAFHPSVILLKRDGTLWQWGDGRNESGLVTFEPRQLGQNSDWERILPMSEYIGFYAWKKDGSAWIISPAQARFKTNEIREKELAPGIAMIRLPMLDNTKWRSIVGYFGRQVGLREDGTLWQWFNPFDAPVVVRMHQKPGLTQIGTETNWAELAGSWGTLGLIKNDGTIWAWNLTAWQGDGQGNFSPIDSPARISRHNDWLAAGYSVEGIVALAADGSLWHWWNLRYYPEGGSILPYLRPTTKPSKIENVLAREK